MGSHTTAYLPLPSNTMIYSCSSEAKTLTRSEAFMALMKISSPMTSSFFWESPVQLVLPAMPSRFTRVDFRILWAMNLNANCIELRRIVKSPVALVPSFCCSCRMKRVKVITSVCTGLYLISDTVGITILSWFNCAETVQAIINNPNISDLKQRILKQQPWSPNNTTWRPW